MKIRTVVKAHLFRERFDVMIAVVAPLIIMLESGYANAWAFAGGKLVLTDPNTWLALGRGIFLEGLVFAMFKMVKLFMTQALSRRSWQMGVIAVIPAAIGMVGMIVSAGCNLGWANQSGEMLSVVQTVSTFMPPFFVGVFKNGLGLLFPIAVGAFALFDTSHLVEEAMTSSDLDSRAILVDRAETHRTFFLKSQKKAAKEVRQQYDDICTVDAANMVKAVKSGDLSFGAKEAQKAVAPRKTSVTPITPPASPQGLLNAPAQPFALPAPASANQASRFNGQGMHNPAFASPGPMNGAFNLPTQNPMTMPAAPAAPPPAQGVPNQKRTVFGAVRQ